MRADDLFESASIAQAGAFAVVSEAFVGVPFPVGTNTYRVRQLSAEWHRSRYELIVPPEEAAVVLERAIEQHRHNAPLVRLLDQAVTGLAGLHANGSFVLLWLRAEAPTVRPASAAASTPAALSPLPAPAAPTPASEELPMAAAQAAVLRSAAAAGVPFCEECARVAAGRAGQMA
jgi:hypothetical protein